MEKKILLLLLYVVVLFYIKKEDLMKVQENREFYIDNIDVYQEELLEATYCLGEEQFSDLNSIQFGRIET